MLHKFIFAAREVIEHYFIKHILCNF
ncbi:hypothetical protein D046_1298A, partial [Vibrio parahaemolyticus V-223/04]